MYISCFFYNIPVIKGDAIKYKTLEVTEDYYNTVEVNSILNMILWFICFFFFLWIKVQRLLSMINK